MYIYNPKSNRKRLKLNKLKPTKQPLMWIIWKPSQLQRLLRLKTVHNMAEEVIINNFQFSNMPLHNILIWHWGKQKGYRCLPVHAACQLLTIALHGFHHKLTIHNWQ